MNEEQPACTMLGHIAEVVFYTESLTERLTWRPTPLMPREYIRQEVIQTCNRLEDRAQKLARYAHQIATEELDRA